MSLIKIAAALETARWRGAGRVLHIVLVEPEIPPNCGNIARTCAATGSRLHLVEPLGFDVSDRAVKRAGLDYWHLVQVSVHPDLDALFALHPEAAEDLWLATTKAPRDYAQAQFREDCWLMFGKETAGLPAVFRQGDRGAAPGVPGEAPGQVRPPAHGQRRPEPQSGQQRRHTGLRGPAAERIPRPDRHGGDGVGSFASFLTMYKEKKNTNIYYTNQTILSKQFERS